MKRLSQLIETIEALKAQIRELEQKRTAVREGIVKSAASGDFERHKGKLIESTAHETMIPIQLGKLETELAEAEEALTEEMGAAARRWNYFVQAKVDEKFDEFIEHILPYFGGKEKEQLTRREFAFFHVPAVHALRAAYADLGDYRLISRAQRLVLAKRLAKLPDTFCAELGWTYPPEKPVLRRSSPPPPAAELRVRARADIPAIGELAELAYASKANATARKPGIIKEGEELTIPYRIYRALARHFEPIN